MPWECRSVLWLAPGSPSFWEGGTCSPELQASLSLPPSIIWIWPDCVTSWIIWIWSDRVTSWIIWILHEFVFWYLRVSQKHYFESHSYSKYALGTYCVPETVLVPRSETHDAWHSAPAGGGWEITRLNLEDLVLILIPPCSRPSDSESVVLPLRASLCHLSDFSFKNLK